MSAQASDVSDSEYERAVLWVPDPNSPAGWIRRKVWAEEPKRKKPPMGFHSPANGSDPAQTTDDAAVTAS
jgi:hypothetical protein